MRERVEQLENRGAQRLSIVANEQYWVCGMPGGSSKVPFPVLADPVSTVSATYGVAFQVHGWNGWTSRRALFVIDPDGIIRVAWRANGTAGQPDDLLQVVDDFRQRRNLIESLRKRSPALRKAADLILTTRPEAKAAIPALVKAIKDEDADVRAGAAAGLYWISAEAESALPSIIESLRDADARVRRCTAEALAVLGPRAEAGVPDLVHLLTDEDRQIQAAASVALERIGPPAVESLMKALSSPEANTRAAVSRALVKFPTEAQTTVPALFAAMRDDDPATRQSAAKSLDLMGPRARMALDSIIEALQHHPESEARAIAARLLRSCGSDAKEGVPVLTAALGDSDAEVRRVVIGSLARIGAKTEVVQASVVRAAKDKDFDVRYQAALAILKLSPGDGEAAAPVFAEVVLHKKVHPNDRMYAAGHLGRIGAAAKSAVPSLIEALNDRDFRVRGSAVKALGEIAPTDGSILAPVVKCLQDSHADVCTSAAVTLGRMGTAAWAATSALRDVLQDPDTGVRQAVADSLKRIDRK